MFVHLQGVHRNASALRAMRIEDGEPGDVDAGGSQTAFERIDAFRNATRGAFAAGGQGCGSWPLPLNPFGQVVGALVGLTRGFGAPRMHAARVSIDNASAIASAPEPTPTPTTADGVSFETASATSEPMPVSPSASVDEARDPEPDRRHASANGVTARHPLGEYAMAAWIRQRCGAADMLGRLTRGLGWTIAQHIASLIGQPRCSVWFDASATEIVPGAGHASALRPDEAVVEVSLVPRGIARRFVVRDRRDASSEPPLVRAPDTAQPPAHRAASEATHGRIQGPVVNAHYLSGWHTPLVQAAVNQVRLGRPAAERNAMTSGYATLSKRLDEFLQGPCGTLVRFVFESSDKKPDLEQWKVRSAVCDYLYQATPIGAKASIFGYLLELTTQVKKGEALSADQMAKAFSVLSIRPNREGVVEVGRTRKIWTGDGLRPITVNDAQHQIEQPPVSALGAPSLPGLPVEHSPEGWRIVSIPDEYVAKGVEVADLDTHTRRLSTSSTAAYVELDGKLYEAERSRGTTRWRIVPPGGRRGLSIPIEFHTDTRRWEAILLVGPGDPAPLPERYAARVDALASGPEHDVYLDAHHEEYDPALLPADAEQTPTEALMNVFATSNAMTPRELGALHQYIEMRRWTSLVDEVNVLNLRQAESPASAAAYLRGVDRADVSRVPGYRSSMTAVELLELVRSGGLTPYEIGACSREAVVRMTIDDVRHEADRLYLRASRSMQGVLRFEHVRIPGLTADATFEDMLDLFLRGALTDTQRGALRPKLQSAAGELNSLMLEFGQKIGVLRALVLPEGEAQFVYGYENYLRITIDRLTPEMDLTALARLGVQHAAQPSRMGAIWRHIELAASDLELDMSMFTEMVEEIDHGYTLFAAGYEASNRIELPPTNDGTLLELGAQFLSGELTLRERGAVYARFQNREIMERINRYVADYHAPELAERIRFGYTEPDAVPGLEHGEASTLDVIASRFARGDLSPEQVGRLAWEADQIDADMTLARVDAFRHRIVTGAEIHDYVDAYLNPGPDDGALAMKPPVGEWTQEALLDLFGRDGMDVRTRGRIAWRITQMEREQVEFEGIVLERIYANAATSARLRFRQTLVPRMLNGLVDGACFALSATMCVALEAGDAAVERFARRLRRIMRVEERAGSPGQVRLRMRDESRNVLAALAALGVRQPRSLGSLIAGEMTLLSAEFPWADLPGLLNRGTLEDGRSTWLIATERHAFAMHGERAPDTADGVRYRFYEPNYGLLTFDRHQAFSAALTQAFRQSYYRIDVFGGLSTVSVYAVDVERLGDLEVVPRAHLRVRDLVGSQPFRAVRRPTHAHAGTQTHDGERMDVDASRVVHHFVPAAGSASTTEANHRASGYDRVGGVGGVGAIPHMPYDAFDADFEGSFGHGFDARRDRPFDDTDTDDDPFDVFDAFERSDARSGGTSHRVVSGNPGEARDDA
ncbi:hypothetical protein [Pararobbsia silviterrae]|nr:hypothetical protein [Pararobbsia silviterrae]